MLNRRPVGFDGIITGGLPDVFTKDGRVAGLEGIDNNKQSGLGRGGGRETTPSQRVCS